MTSWLRPLYERWRRGIRGYPSYGWTTPAREEFLWHAMQYVGSSQLAGDYAEFGVWRGDTLATAYRLAEYLAPTFPPLRRMRFYAFDSFQGFPEPQGEDVLPIIQRGGRACTVSQFEARMARHRVAGSRVQAVPGWFAEVLAPSGRAEQLQADGSVALAYVDCDLYESARDVLPYLKRKMAPGGLIAFDNWFLFLGHPLRGEQKAYREFLQANPDVTLVPFRQFGWHGRSFIFHQLNEREQRQLVKTEAFHVEMDHG